MPKRTASEAHENTVMFEDAAALLGLVLAFLGVFLGHQLRNLYFDGIASVLIGLMLAALACMLEFCTIRSALA